MEVTSCIKSVVVATNQYRNNPCDANVVHLQRQIDVLVGVTGKGISLKAFDPGQLLPAECLSCLVDILNDSHTRPTLAQKTMTLMGNLTAVSEIRQALHESFNMTATLAGYLKTQCISTSDPSTMQCIKLLQKITYKCKISYQENYVEDLVKFLIKQITNKESELTQPCLGLLANMCRNNFSMQTHIKHLENVKTLTKILINYLSHRNQTVAIYVLSILTSLCLHEDLGQKLFNSQNINQTFQLMFSILVDGDSGVTRRYAVDLFTDLITHSKIQQSLVVYDHLGACLKRVCALLCKKDGDSVSKILELLIAFSSVNGIRTLLCKTLMESPPQDPISAQSSSVPLPAVINWASVSPQVHTVAPSLALQLLKEMYEELIDSGLTIPIQADLVLPMLIENLMSSAKQRDPEVLKPYCEKVVNSIKLLRCLCMDSEMRANVSASIDVKTCLQLVEYQLTHNRISLVHADADDWSQTGVDVVLLTLDLMSYIKRFVPDMEEGFLKVMQDSRLVPFLGQGMTSQCRDRVHIALRLISGGVALKQFPTGILGDHIAGVNSKQAEQLSKERALGPNSHSPNKNNTAMIPNYGDKENIPLTNNWKKKKPQTEELDLSVQSLIEKMQTGLELKDMKVSEIINVYEHRLQSLQTRENHLQDLLEAKATALAQADRLIAQYRCRRAQYEAETSKMRSLLQESERKSEEYREQLNEMMLEREKRQTDLEQLLQDNTRLEVIAEEHRELTQSFTDQANRLENTQRSLSTLRQEHQAMSEMHEMLKRHNETLKQQHDVASEQLAELEEERKNLSRNVKEKDIKVNSLTKQLSKTEEGLKKSNKERDELEMAIDKLRDNIAKTEKKKKELEHQVTSLELVCRQHESSIREKETVVLDQKARLDKLGQITELIHSLSGGPGEKK